MKKEAKLILGGGAAYGLAHIGAIEAIKEEFTITGIVGTSMGAIIGAMIAMGKTPQQILALASDQRSASIFNPISVPPLTRASQRCTDEGLNSKKAVKNLFDNLTKGVNIEDLELPFVAIAYDLNSCSTVLIDKGSLSAAIRASSSLPIVFPPYSTGKYLFVDGGVEHPLPIAFGNSVPGKFTIAINVLPPVSTNAERFTLGTTTTRKRLWAHQVFIKSVMQNQGFVAIQAMLQNPPDLIIDAYNPDKKMFDLFKVKEFYDYGYKVAKQSIERYHEPGFAEQLLDKYRALISRFSKH